MTPPGDAWSPAGVGRFVTTLVQNESNDQLESECMSFKDLSSERGRSNSIMHVGHWTLTFELVAPSAIKPVFSEEQPPILNWRMCIDYRKLKKIKDEVCA